MKVITNGNIILEDEMMENGAVVIDKDIIIDILPAAEAGNYIKDAKSVIDAGGGYVTPGFIDIHSDYIEGIIAPRPTSMMDFNLGIRESERILSSHGISTMFHSLSIYKKDMFGHKPIRSPENVDKLIRAIDQTHNEKRLIRHRLHARFEIDSVEQLPMIKEHIEQDRVHLLSFMDHTPGQGQYRDIEMYLKTMKGYQNISDAQIVQVMEQKKNHDTLSFEDMKELSDLATDKGIAVASHDDDSTEKIELAKRLGTTISEFPIYMNVAKYAHQEKIHTLAGAPNIMLGGSHSGNLNAREAIEEGCISILCSDYYPASMLHGVFKLHQQCDFPLEDAVRLITINPAKAVNMDDELGSIKVGKKADINVIRMDGDYPIITECIVNGFTVSRYHYRVD